MIVDSTDENRDLIPLHSHTIAALATPAGRGGIGIIRVSGKDAFQITDSLCASIKNSKTRTKPCASYPPYSIHRSLIIGTEGNVIDDVLISVFHAPRSYTGENVVEISAHGGAIPIKQILARLYEAGARPADPGEFTMRAYLNGKMDLAQAEAVADIINAETEEAAKLAKTQQSGRLSHSVNEIKDIILGILARIEASIDFPEDVGELDVEFCKEETLKAINHIMDLLSTAQAGIIYRDGIKIVLAGRPNVGKSSLMNALLRTERSIVTPIPGTTRDVIEESANIRGIKVRFLDTAGIRETTDIVESIGVERSRDHALSSDLILLVIDASAPDQDADSNLEAQLRDVPVIKVYNKWDLLETKPEFPASAIAVSARTGWNLLALEEAILDKVTSGNIIAIDDKSAIVTHTRHLNALKSALNSLHNAVATIDAALPPDFISIDVRGALVSLGEITGETATDDIINEIFSRFCIGK